jgi:hypothetical protein
MESATALREGKFMSCLDRVFAMPGADKLSKEEMKDILKTFHGMVKSDNFPKKAKIFRDRTQAEKLFSENMKAKKTLGDARMQNRFLTDFQDDLQGAIFSIHKTTGFKTKSGASQNIDATMHNFVRDQQVQFRKVFSDNTSTFFDGELKKFRDGSLDSDLADYMFKMRNNIKIEGKVDPLIKRVGDKMGKFSSQFVQSLKNHGIHISETKDFLWSQTHDMKKIFDSGFDTWSKKMLAELDSGRSFPTAKNINEKTAQLKETFDAIMNGTFDHSIGKSGTFGGKRSYHFEDGAAWQRYNAEYGKGNMIDTIQATIRAASKHAAVSKIIGPDYEGGMKTLEKFMLKHTEERIALASGNEKVKLQKMLDDFNDDKSFIGQADQRASIKKEFFPSTRKGFDGKPKYGAMVLKIKAATSLVLSVFKTVPDISTSAGILRAYTGSSFLQSHVDLFKGALMALDPKVRAQTATRLNIVLTMQRGGDFDRYGANVDNFKDGGAVMRSADRLLTWNGLAVQSAFMEDAVSIGAALRMGSVKDISYDKLTKAYRSTLDTFDISGKEWDSMRTKTNEYEPGIHGIAPENLSGKLQIKVGSMLESFAKGGVPQPNTVNRALMTRGLSVEDPLGFLLRALTQFKSFQFSVGDSLKRIANVNPDADSRTLIDAFSQRGNLKRIVPVMVQGSALAIFGGMMQDAIRGRDIRDLDNETVAKGMQEGLLPFLPSLLASFAMEEDSKFGRDPVTSQLGPLLNEAGKLIKNVGGTVGIGAAISDKSSEQASKSRGKSASKLFDQALGNTPIFPLQSLWMPLIKKHVTSHLQETWNPDYRENLERRQRKLKENGTR